MSLCIICDICGYPLQPEEVNVVSFFEHNPQSEHYELVRANPRLELCANCFTFLKEVVRSAKTVTIDDIEKEA